MIRYPILLLSLVLLCAHQGVSQEIAADSTTGIKLDYGSKGFELRTADNRYMLQIQSRLQFRYAAPDDQDPIEFTDYDPENTNVFKINRARLKVGGHAYQPWLKYYWEYDVVGSNILDFRLMIEKWEWLNFKVGQWKIEYSRERRISSGDQQLVDRSIINRPFTVDRQQGVEVYGRIDQGGLLDFNYWLALLTGTGRGSLTNDDSHLMYFGRIQWNFLGDGLDFTASDLEFHQKPGAILALAAVTNRSPYTRFSTGGGGELAGFENGQPGQYAIKQVNLESALMYRGFSWQSEFHVKEITDTLNDDAFTRLVGYYFQAGYFFHQSFSWWPEQLEVAVRYAGYEPDLNLDLQEERSLNLNWFFKGHKNKLSMEISNFDAELADETTADKWRFRIQWDISL